MIDMLINLMGGLTSRCTPISNHHVALIDFKYITILSILHDKDEKNRLYKKLDQA